MMPTLRQIASLHLTLVALALLAGGVVWAYLGNGHRLWPVVGPLALLATNLAAAIATRPAFRAQPALLIFHLALLGLVLLLGVGQMSQLRGHVELTEGMWFEGQLNEVEAGPWHVGDLDQVRFTNAGYSIEYAAGLRRGATRNLVQWPDENGVTREAVIGDQTPLVINGYRFYTSFNKGYAPTFAWRADAQAEPLVGSVHLPSYPIHEYQQARAWTPPGADAEVWILLEMDEAPLDPARATHFRLPDGHRLIVRVGDARQELQPGDRLTVGAGGALQYLGLRTWMGYTVFYDWTIPWLLAACLIAVIAMAWHFWRHYAPRPWLADLPANR